ncbi:MAG: extensin family protein [Deltaproteobacteria bacterium]
MNHCRLFFLAVLACLWGCLLPRSAAAGSESSWTAEPWREQLWASWNSLHGDAYGLDAVGRRLEQGQHLDCDGQNLVRYAGSDIRYQGGVFVHPEFRERLARFESLVAEVGREIYGRAPTRLRHAGAFNCRSTRQRSYRISEHALGNAIDILGFDFGPAKRRAPLPAGLAKALRRSFQVRVARHWHEAASDPVATLHATFLRTLAARLEERGDVFRVMIGPSHRDHADHFHFDMSPWHYVNF